MSALLAEAPVVPPPPGKSSADILGGRMEELDGLRGLGLIMVVLGHSLATLPTWAKSCPDAGICRPLYMTWVGVDFFFVLSGFLITGILLDSKGGKGYFRAFYARRVLRIFPLYYASLAVMFFVVPLFRHNEGHAWLLAHQGWFWGCLQNWLMASHGGIVPGGGWVVHYWSLGIEEQFYVFWPLLVLLCSRRVLVSVCGVFIVASFAVRAWMQSRHFDPDAIYMVTPARLDLLAWGAVVAALARRPGGIHALVRPARAAFAVGLAALLVAAALDGRPTNHSRFIQLFGFSATGVLGAGLMVLLITLPADSRVGHAFRFPVATWLGRRSYAIYVVHLAIVYLMRNEVGGRVVLATGSTVCGVLASGFASLAVAAAVAEVSARCLEEPVLRLRKHFPIPRPKRAARATSPAPGSCP